MSNAHFARGKEKPLIFLYSPVDYVNQLAMKRLELKVLALPSYFSNKRSRLCRDLSVIAPVQHFLFLQFLCSIRDSAVNGSSVFGPQPGKQHYGIIQGQILPRRHLKTDSDRFARRAGLVDFYTKPGLDDSVDALNNESE